MEDKKQEIKEKLAEAKEGKNEAKEMKSKKKVNIKGALKKVISVPVEGVQYLYYRALIEIAR
jgi:F0F1-type ATP synthase membrane subunit b/b'